MSAEVLKGHLDGMLLSVLDGGALHGYAIKEALHRDSGGRFDLPTGTVYPALRRLERAGLTKSQWSMVEGRKRRTYELTKAGRTALESERASWREFATAVSALMEGRGWPATS